jgi:hypothetical protein
LIRMRCPQPLHVASFVVDSISRSVTQASHTATISYCVIAKVGLPLPSLPQNDQATFSRTMYAVAFPPKASPQRVPVQGLASDWCQRRAYDQLKSRRSASP